MCGRGLVGAAGLTFHQHHPAQIERMQIKPQLKGKLECVFEARRDEYYEIHKLSM